MADNPRLSVLDKLLTSTGFATIGRAVRDSVVAFATTEESPQDIFTIFEYRHVHRNDWAKFRSSAATWYAIRLAVGATDRKPARSSTRMYRFRMMSSRVWPSASPGSDASSSLEDYCSPALGKEPELTLRTYPYMFFPLAPAKVLWDYAIMFLVAYNAVELPYSIAFDFVPCDVRIHNMACHRF